MQIAIFTTGGTIDKVYFDAKGKYHVGSPMVRELLEHARLSEMPEITELLRKDSLEMDDADRQAIRAALQACPAPRILVTHGTDTIVATALALAGIPAKTIVLTGALQPGRFADSDAAFNLGLAYGAVQLCSPGVYVVANGTVFPGHKVRKNRELNRFEPL
ncbi:MAG TPA: asparaginase domain-containing protein [Steroidobacteraceae bacterium]|jgi:L-asparaginase|nr:asparaginase domain-containing protein [Steroidobacteraceae bacterium]